MLILELWKTIDKIVIKSQNKSTRAKLIQSLDKKKAFISKSHSSFPFFDTDKRETWKTQLQQGFKK